MIYDVVVLLERDGKSVPVRINPQIGVALSPVKELYPREVKLIHDLLATLSGYRDMFPKPKNEEE